MTNDFPKFLKGSGEGRLKVYLGMAAGVGKTVAMLREAKRLRAEGIDVVSGIIETHGRAETAAEFAGLEIIPRRTIQYHGVSLQDDRPEFLIEDFELPNTRLGRTSDASVPSSAGWLSGKGQPAALSDHAGEPHEITTRVRDRLCMASDGAVGRFEFEYRLARVLGERHKASIVPEGGEHVWIRLSRHLGRRLCEHCGAIGLRNAVYPALICLHGAVLANCVLKHDISNRIHVPGGHREARRHLA